MVDLYYARARVSELRREAALHSLAKLVPAKPKPVRQRPALTAAEVELHKSVAYSAVNGALS